MRLRSFHGENLNDAMRQVRDALGKDAIIVATRNDDSGGVRVTAAIDDNMALDEKNPLITPDINFDPSIEQDMSELIAMQFMRHDVHAELAEQLLAIVNHFANHNMLVALGAAIEKHFQFTALIDGSNKPICLVGPPGAGKTLTIAKIAASRVLNKKHVGVITTDLTRAGAVEQLSAYTKLLKLNLFEVEDKSSLKDAIDAHKRSDMALIDNTGRNPFDKADMESLRELVNTAVMEPVMVIPAGIDAYEAMDMAYAFKDIGAKKVILTKIDMARRLGSLLRMANVCGLSLCEYSNSPRVTDPLQPLNPVTFARLLLPPEIVADILKSKPAAAGA